MNTKTIEILYSLSLSAYRAEVAEATGPVRRDRRAEVEVGALTPAARIALLDAATDYGTASVAWPVDAARLDAAEAGVPDIWGEQRLAVCGQPDIRWQVDLDAAPSADEVSAALCALAEIQRAWRTERDARREREAAADAAARAADRALLAAWVAEAEAAPTAPPILREANGIAPPVPLSRPRRIDGDGYGWPDALRPRVRALHERARAEAKAERDAAEAAAEAAAAADRALIARLLDARGDAAGAAQYLAGRLPEADVAEAVLAEIWRGAQDAPRPRPTLDGVLDAYEGPLSRAQYARLAAVIADVRPESLPDAEAVVVAVDLGDGDDDDAPVYAAAQIALTWAGESWVWHLAL